MSSILDGTLGDLSLEEDDVDLNETASLQTADPRCGQPHTLSSLFTLNHDVLAEIMNYLSQSDQAHLARTCHSLHTATLPHRCSSHIQLFPADRIVSSFLAFLRLNTLGESRAPLINKLYIAITTSGPVVDWQTALTRPTPGYRASFPWITDTILDILARCTNLSTLSVNSWSARLPADRLCNTIAALDSLEDLHLAVTSDRLWAATTAFARLPRLRRLALHLAVDPGFSIDFVPIDPAPLPLVSTFSPQTLTELRLSYDRAARMDACLPSVRRLHLTLTAQRTPENVLPTLAHAFPNLTSLTYGTRGWLALDERTAAQWRGANRAWARDVGRAAWPQLTVLGGLDVRDLWVLGLAHKVPHVCVAEADPFLGARRPGQSRSGPEAAAWVRRMRRMLPAVLADARPTHLELAATWHLEAHWGEISKNGNSVETLSALWECGGAPWASGTHLIVNVPAPEVLEDRIMAELCAVLPNLVCTHLYVRVLRQPAEEARGPEYCARLLLKVKQRLESYASSVAQASPSLSCVAFYLEGVSLQAWGISRPGSDGPQLEEMSELKAWAVLAEEKLYAHQSDFSRSEEDIPLESLNT